MIQGAGADTRPVVSVHIGLNKTGTTSIQVWLRENAAMLRSRGIFHDMFTPNARAEFGGFAGIPACGLSRCEQMVPRGTIRRELELRSLDDQKAKTDAFSDRFEHAISQSGCDRVILSSECIAAWIAHPVRIIALDTWLRETFKDVEYVLYLRDQADWATSAYTQSIKAGATHSPETFINKRGEYNFNGLVRAWQRAVGGNKVKVRLLDKSFLIQGDLITDFADTLDINTEGLTLPKRVNESPGAFALKIMRYSNRILGKFISRATLHNLNDKMVNVPLIQGKKFRFSPQQMQHIRALNAETNEKLRSRMFRNRSTLFATAIPALAP
jgi:hypothetical protein